MSPTYVKDQFYNILCSDLQSNPDQPRQFFDEGPLTDLANSVDKHGLLQPVLFGQADDGKLFIVAGERRVRAAIKAEQKTIPARFVEGNYAEIALEENLKREDLNPIELAEALHKLKEVSGYTDKQLIAIIGKAKSTISEILAPMRLPQEIRDRCRKDPNISRADLLKIVKKKTDDRMKAAFDKYKAQKEAKDKSDKKPRQRKTWIDHVASMSSDLNHILDKKTLAILGATQRTTLVTSLEELKKMADSLIKKIKTASVEETKPTVTPKSKRVDISATKTPSVKKTEPTVKAKPKRIEIPKTKPKK